MTGPSNLRACLSAKLVLISNSTEKYYTHLLYTCKSKGYLKPCVWTFMPNCSLRLMSNFKTWRIFSLKVRWSPAVKYRTYYYLHTYIAFRPFLGFLVNQVMITHDLHTLSKQSWLDFLHWTELCVKYD